jgi:choline-sulfatase
MLYHLKEDPFEQHNVADCHPEVCREAVYLLNEWHDEMMSSMSHDTDPLWTVMKEGGPFHAKGHLQEYAKRLEQSERAEAVVELKRRHP